ncbi:hypothetical protein [Thiomicrospira sp. WB1]|uniref:hypothetical protein n=1 Tax=Thiomicrospira sp. WB1 TaxID=1685380 RepID=UPI0007482DE2|nr:hypothetical protein [Thiomicrospira sp. WB1]KUJ71593.1 hypothetical protein AVO41_08755 [Thiomicrospira sp. WB1]
MQAFKSISITSVLALALQGCSLTPPEPNVLLPAAAVVGAYKLYEHNQKTTYYQPDYYQTSQLAKSADASVEYRVEELRCQKYPSACDTSRAEQVFQESGQRLASDKDVNDLFETLSF